MGSAASGRAARSLVATGWTRGADSPRAASCGSRGAHPGAAGDQPGRAAGVPDDGAVPRRDRRAGPVGQRLGGAHRHRGGGGAPGRREDARRDRPLHVAVEQEQGAARVAQQRARRVRPARERRGQHPGGEQRGVGVEHGAAPAGAPAQLDVQVGAGLLGVPGVAAPADELPGEHPAADLEAGRHAVGQRRPAVVGAGGVVVEVHVDGRPAGRAAAVGRQHERALLAGQRGHDPVEGGHQRRHLGAHEVLPHVHPGAARAAGQPGVVVAGRADHGEDHGHDHRRPVEGGPGAGVDLDRGGRGGPDDRSRAAGQGGREQARRESGRAGRGSGRTAGRGGVGAPWSVGTAVARLHAFHPVAQPLGRQ